MRTLFLTTAILMSGSAITQNTPEQNKSAAEGRLVLIDSTEDYPTSAWFKITDNEYVGGEVQLYNAKFEDAKSVLDRILTNKDISINSPDSSYNDGGKLVRCWVINTADSYERTYVIYLTNDEKEGLISLSIIYGYEEVKERSEE